MARVRADKLVVDQGLAPTRSRAQALILAGVVKGEGDRRIDKPGELIAPDVQLHLKGDVLPYVSRGGLKLQGALDHFHIDPTDAVCLDVGASTGGFTDCLLQRGARKVYALDVGYGQLAWSIRQDPRVVVIERTNIRSLVRGDAACPVDSACDVIVFDVSFISLRLVLPPALQFAASPCRIIALVKPQFEVGRADIGKGGIVRDAAARQRALDEAVAECQALGLVDIQTMVSPIEGAKGNQEFLLTGLVIGPATYVTVS